MRPVMLERMFGGDVGSLRFGVPMQWIASSQEACTFDSGKTELKVFFETSPGELGFQIYLEHWGNELTAFRSDAVEGMRRFRSAGKGVIEMLDGDIVCSRVPPRIRHSEHARSGLLNVHEWYLARRFEHSLLTVDLVYFVDHDTAGRAEHAALLHELECSIRAATLEA